MRLLTLLGTLVFLSACGTSSFYTGAQGTMTQTQAQSQLSSITSAAKTDFSAPGQLPSVGGLRGARSGFFDSCSTISPNPLVDGDGDNIPLEKRVFFTCNDASLPGHTGLYFDLTGNAHIVDKDDSKSGGGYRYEYNNIVGGSHNSDNTNNESYSYNGLWELTGDATSWSYNSNFQGSSSSVDTRAGTYSSTYGSTWAHTLIADDASDPGKSGSITMNGYYGYSVSNSADPSQDASFVLGIKSTDLKYKRDSCGTYYESGSYELTDAANNVLKITFSSCARTCTFNGSTISC